MLGNFNEDVIVVENEGQSLSFAKKNTKFSLYDDQDLNFWVEFTFVTLDFITLKEE